MATIWHSPSCTLICKLDDTLVPHQASEFMLGEKLLFEKLLSTLSVHQGKTLGIGVSQVVRECTWMYSLLFRKKEYMSKREMVVGHETSKKCDEILLEGKQGERGSGQYDHITCKNLDCDLHGCHFTPPRQTRSAAQLHDLWTTWGWSGPAVNHGEHVWN